MTAVAPALVIALASLGVLALAPQFRSGIEIVNVDVLVKRGGRPAPGLTAENFELFDSGVRQRIQSVETQTLPLHVMLVLDVSGSTEGRPLQHLKVAARVVVDSLRPGDRMALLTFSDRVQLRAAWTRDSEKLREAVDQTSAGGATALRDALFAAIGLREGIAGRMLLIVFSDGHDTASWLAPRDILAAADRADVAIHVVQTMDLPAKIDSELRRQVTENPHMDDTFMLPVLAHDTGGGAQSVADSARLSAAFLKIIDDFRSGYVLTYSPQGVPKGGWHPIDVRLKGTRGDVQARRGYSSQ